jgi:hypothetical protein
VRHKRWCAHGKRFRRCGEVDPFAGPGRRLIRPSEEIGVSLTEEDQLDPEQSTSAVVVTHAQAKYFSV